MNFEEILYGVAYYDEYMPYDRIETDFKMIRDAGMNVIRIAESTWSTWEPKECARRLRPAEQTAG